MGDKDDKAVLVRRVISEQLGIAQSEAADEETMRGLGADELDEIEIAMGLEDVLGIDIPDGPLLQGDGKTTVKQVIDFVLQHAKAT